MTVSREQLRAFHLTGRGLDALVPSGALHPTLLEQLELPRVERSYPIYFSDSQPPEPFVQFLGKLAGENLRKHAELIAAAFERQIGSRGFASLSSVADAALAGEILPLEDRAALRRALPSEGWLIGFGKSAPLLLTCAALQSARREARQSFAQKLRESGERLRELLGVDDRKTESSPERVVQSLGARASSFLNPPALVEALRHRPNATLPMEPERRVRCESALATIRDAIEDWRSLPSIIVVHSGPIPEELPDGGIQYENAADACDFALSLRRRQLARYVPVWKALRIARLEAESAFDPSIHTGELEAFDFFMAQPSEVAALPAVLVSETAQRMEQCQASFASLLQSGLPVQVLIACDGAPANSGFLPFGCREAFALHSSVASTAHLIGGLSEMAATLRPSAAFVAFSESWTEASLLLLARAVPLWRYHPDHGESWYRRFSLETSTAASNEQLTLAHVAALMPAFRSHFRVLPAGVDSAEAFPFLPVTDENRQPGRALFTRELANLCSEAEKRWRFLAELAAPEDIKEAGPDPRDSARLDGARQAILRVISILKNGEVELPI